MKDKMELSKGNKGGKWKRSTSGKCIPCSIFTCTKKYFFIGKFECFFEESHFE